MKPSFYQLNPWVKSLLVLILTLLSDGPSLQAQSTDPVSASRSSLSVSPLSPLPLGGTFTLTCIVKDASGRVIANAAVTIFTKPFQEVASGFTDAQGVFQATATSNQEGSVTYYARAGTPSVEFTQSVTVTYFIDTIRYVKEGGTGLGTGTSWSHASGDLQAMIDLKGVTQVYVAGGHYTRVGGNSFSLKSGVAVYGGFSSTAPETRPSQRPAINPRSGQYSSTTLTVGSNGGSVIRNTGGIDSTAILDGVVITGGRALDPTASSDGGGISNVGSHPQIINCLISDNIALRSGGGVYNRDSSPTLTGCMISGNSAGSGGGILTLDNQSATLFSNKLILTSCTISSNSAASGGGGIANTVTDMRLTDCLITGNSSRGDGGGIHNRGVGQHSVVPSLINCVIRDNTAGRNGGGIKNEGYQFDQKSYPSLRNCVIRDNKAGYGGGVYNSDDSRPRLTNCLISGNQANDGGGVYNLDSSPILNGCTLTANRAPGGGDALSNKGISRANLTNCILWDNQEENSASISFDGGRVGATLDVNYSLIGQGEGDLRGAHNLTATTSPFAGPSDYQLAPCSIAINTGDPASTTALNPGPPESTTPTSGPTDLAGNARFYNTRIDLGAYEFQGLNGTDGFLLEITQQPAGVETVPVGTSVSTMVRVSGNNPTYQWYKDDLNSPVPGQTSATLILTNVQPSDAGSYVAVITGSCNSLTSTAFQLNLIPPTQPIRYVRQNGMGDGTSWADASSDLQGQINLPGVEQVWVAQGSYTPGADRSLHFSLKNGVSILGGFPPVGTPTLTDRNPASYTTVLSGEIGQPGDLTDNSYQVLVNTNSELNATAVLDGVVITGGYGYANGGGVRIENGSPRLVNCLITGNSAYQGGGLYTAYSSLTLINCTISGNTADYGGGLYTSRGTVVMINGLISNNTATVEGGGLFTNSNGDILLLNVTLSSNTAVRGGALLNQASNPSLVNSIVFNHGGANTFSTSINSNNFLIRTSYCLIETGATGYTSGPGTLTASSSPFVSPTSFQLKAGSVAINAGSTAAYTTAGGPATDLGGKGRIQNGTIDMGAYEADLPPDLIPILYVTPSLAYSTTTGSVVVEVFEINSAPTSGPITVYIAKSSLLSLRFDPGATSLAGKPVQNSLWSFDGTSNSDAYILTTTQVIGASGKRSIGLSSTLTPGQTKGRVSVTATLVGGSGGEVTLTNNTDADQVEYFNK